MAVLLQYRIEHASSVYICITYFCNVLDHV